MNFTKMSPRIALLFGLLLVFGCDPVYYHSIRATVLDERTGQPVVGVPVRIADARSGSSRRSEGSFTDTLYLTDAQGTVRVDFSTITDFVDSVSLSIRADGYDSVRLVTDPQRWHRPVPATHKKGFRYDFERVLLLPE